MARRNWLLAALLVAAPATAEVVEFAGRNVEVDGARAGRPVVRVSGPQYSIPGSAAQIIRKAQICTTQLAGETGIESADPDTGRLVASHRVDYGKRRKPHSVRTQLSVEAADGNLRIILGELGVAQAGIAQTQPNGYAPLVQADSGWEDALNAAIAVEQALLDCIYR